MNNEKVKFNDFGRCLICCHNPCACDEGNNHPCIGCGQYVAEDHQKCLYYKLGEIKCNRCNDNGCPACDGTNGSEYNPEPY